MECGAFNAPMWNNYRYVIKQKKAEQSQIWNLPCFAVKHLFSSISKPVFDLLKYTQCISKDEEIQQSINKNSFSEYW